MPDVILDVDDPPIDLLDVPRIADIPGLPGYRASTEGRIWSVKRHKWLKLQPSKGGYLKVGISGKTYFVHHLILFAFVGPKPDGMEARHLHGNPADNRWPENLAWSTHLVNMRDKYDHGTQYQLNKTECPQGHEYSDENTYVYINKRGKPERYCLTCRRDRMYARDVNAKRHAKRTGPRKKLIDTGVAIPVETERYTPPDLQ